MTSVPATATADIPSMKDRSNVAALVLVLEAIVTAVAKSHLATLDSSARAAFRAEISNNLGTICDEVVAQAPVTGNGARLAPKAAKLAASILKEKSEGLLDDYLGDLFPAAAQ